MERRHLKRKSLPNRDELALREVRALPNDSRTRPVLRDRCVVGNARTKRVPLGRNDCRLPFGERHLFQLLVHLGFLYMVFGPAGDR